MSLYPRSSTFHHVRYHFIHEGRELIHHLDSTVFGENIRRTDEYFYHRIEANLPCHTCHIIPLHNLCTTCPADIAVHVQHSMPLSQAFSGRDSKGKAEGDPSMKFDPTCESCPTCSGKSVLPSEDPKYHLCGCEIEGREAAYHVVWDEIRPNIVKEVTS